MSDFLILIGGGRKFDNQEAFDKVMDQYLADKEIDPATVKFIHGAAPGADTLADVYAFSRGMRAPEKHPAKWDDLNAPGAIVKETKWGRKYNAKAGHDRNAKMREIIRVGKGHVVTFWDGKSPGTREMVFACWNAKLPLTVYYYDPDTLEIIKSKAFNHD